MEKQQETEVTVVIPNYNGISFLKDCMDSLYEQNPGTPPYSVIVIDNGSTDGSLELLRERFPRVRVEALPENTGFCHAVNVGIRLSETPYVILLNNDTKVKSQFIKKLVEAISKREDAFSVSARMLMWDRPELLDAAGDRYCVLGWAYGRGKGKAAVQYDKACRVFSACGGAAIYRKTLFEEIGYFDEAHFAYLEDVDIGYRAQIFGYRNYYEPAAEVIHFGSASSGSRYNEFKTVHAAANNVYVIGKNMPLLQWIWNFPFLFIGFLIKFFFFCKKGMGILYLRGIASGFRKLFSRGGRDAKVHFKLSRWKNYLFIQGQLYANTIRFLKKN